MNQDKLSVYLDYAAATPVDARVLRAMTPYFNEVFYNPSASYLAGHTARDAVRQARELVAECIGARPAEIVFTAGGTESDNLAIHGIMQRYPNANCVVSAVEHDAILLAANQYDHSLAPVDQNGGILLQKLEELINDKTVLVSIMYANNEVGTVQPVRKVSQIIEKIRQNRKKTGNSLPLYLHSDASQAANYLDIHVHRQGVDLMTLNGGKMYGPKQTGCLYVKAGVKLEPQIIGGGQEHGVRSGTENVPGIIGFSEALRLAQECKPEDSRRIGELRDYFLQKLSKITPNLVVNGGSNRLPNNLHITLPGYDNERLVMELDERGVMCAVGSACSASNEDPSHVLMAMGISEEAAQSSLRFTLGRQTTKADIDYTLQALQGIITH